MKTDETPALSHRLARADDADGLTRLMDAAISELQKPFVDVAQITSSRALMGLDSQLRSKRANSDSRPYSKGRGEYLEE